MAGIVLLAAIFLFKVYFLDTHKDNQREQSAIEHSQDDEKPSNSSKTKGKSHSKKVDSSKPAITSINWDKFSQDTIAVLEIPGVLEYPVVQGKDNSYYLHRDLDKTYKYSGTLFIDFNNAKDFSDDNTIIYGHNMNSGSMFGSLKKYKSESFMKAHKYLFVHTRGVDGENDGLLKFEIRNVCIVNPGSKIYTLSFGDDFTQQDYIKSFHGLFGNKLDEKSKICTLSTCTNFGRQRLCIQGSCLN